VSDNQLEFQQQNSKNFWPNLPWKHQNFKCS